MTKFNTLPLLLYNILLSILYFCKCGKQTTFTGIHIAPWVGKRSI